MGTGGPLGKKQQGQMTSLGSWQLGGSGGATLGLGSGGKARSKSAGSAPGPPPLPHLEQLLGVAGVHLSVAAGDAHQTSHCSPHVQAPSSQAAIAHITASYDPLASGSWEAVMCVTSRPKHMRPACDPLGLSSLAEGMRRVHVSDGASIR